MARFSHQLLSAGAALLMAPSVVGSTMNLLQWNPHWQCFVWNQNDCANQAVAHATQFLTEHDVDFANFVEMENPAYKYPHPWKGLDHKCGRDVTSLVYNSDRWRPDAGNPRTGCMEQDDRPWIMQRFSRIGGDFSVLVIGAHYGHFGAGVQELSQAVATMLQGTPGMHAVLIADTNAWSSVSSADLAGDGHGGIGLHKGGNILSTSLEATCCYDSNFRPSMTYDRVIANFGTSMTTKVLINAPIPTWAQQVKSGFHKGAFHLPILGQLAMSGEIVASAAASNRTEVVVV